MVVGGVGLVLFRQAGGNPGCRGVTSLVRFPPQRRPRRGPRPWEGQKAGRSAAEVTALVADEARAQRLLGWLVPDGDPLVALSAAEVERLCWYEPPRKCHADARE